MPSSRLPVATAVALAAAACLLAGCGSDSSPAFGSSGASTVATDSGAPSDTSNPPTDTSDPPTDTTSTAGGAATSTDYYSTTLPDGWTTQDDAAQGAIIAAYAGPRVEDFTVNVNVTREATGSLSLRDYQARAVAYVQSQLPVRDLSATHDATVGDEPALTYDYTLTQSGREIHQQQFVVVHEGFGYVVTFSAVGDSFDEYLDAAEQIVTSLRWK